MRSILNWCLSHDGQIQLLDRKKSATLTNITPKIVTFLIEFSLTEYFT